MNTAIPPIIFGLFLLMFGAISFFARSRLSSFGARFSAGVSSPDHYDKAYSRRLKYGFVTGIIFMLAGTGFLIAGVVIFIVELT